MITITFVGSGDAFGSGGRLQTCIFLQTSSTGICIDFGASSLIGLRRENIDPNDVSVILLTHLHGDHCGGVPFFLLDAMLGSKRQSPLTIAGPPGTREHLRKLQDALFPGSLTMEPGFPVNHVEIVPGASTDVAGFVVDAIEARHTRETNPLAVRVNLDGRTVAYTGDGELSDALIELASGVDLLVAESYFYNRKINWHLNYPDIASLHPRRIVLTHMHTNMLENLKEVSEECAYDGYRISI